MPLFLFWYILRDLLKLLVVSTTIMVVVISFGAAIQPLSKGLIGPVRLTLFILLAMPPMLQFALPFSAAFSATIVYHRMAQDNELSACAVSGVPYTQLLLPAATLGIVLTIGMSLLTNYVSPRFWEAMNRTAHLDAPEFFIRSVQRGEPIEAGNTLIRAEDVEAIPQSDDSSAYASLRVFGLSILILEKGEVEAIATAPQGVFNLTRVGNNTVVTSAIDQLVVLNEANEDVLRTEDSQFEPMVFPSGFKESPKFMDLNQLRQIVDHPERFPSVADKIDDFRIWLTRRQLYLELDGQLRASGRAVLTGLPGSEGEPPSTRVEVYGSALAGNAAGNWLIRPEAESGRVRAVRFHEGNPDYEIISETAHLEPRLRSMLVEPTVDVIFSDAVMHDLSLDVTNRKDSTGFSRLRATKPIASEIRELSTRELADLARRFGDDEVVKPMTNAIDHEIRKVTRKIVSRIHERTALSVSCLVMLLLGATLAIRLRHALPLTVYFCSFVPAIIGLILISSGTDLLRSVDASNATGMAVTWSGNLLMAVFVLITLRQVRRT